MAEPWTLECVSAVQAETRLVGVRLRNCDGVSLTHASRKTSQRIVAALNATAGMSDPAAEIAALRAEVERLLPMRSKTTPASRERLRELASPPRDDFDRVVLQLLDDYAAAVSPSC